MIDSLPCTVQLSGILLQLLVLDIVVIHVK
jgi:hypothetical protein